MFILNGFVDKLAKLTEEVTIATVRGVGYKLRGRVFMKSFIREIYSYNSCYYDCEYSYLHFLVVNTYYHQVLKGHNDEKNMRIAESIAAFIDTNEGLDLEQYLETQAAVGYKIICCE